jgi:predicted ATPase
MLRPVPGQREHPEEVQDAIWGEEAFALLERSASAHLLSFGATNFRSFLQFNLKVGRLTVLAGPNGAGKSSVVDVPRFISDALSVGLFPALERRGGVRAVRHMAPTKPRDFSVYAEIGFSDGYTANYQIKLKSTAGGDYVVAEEDCQTFKAGASIARLRFVKGKVVEAPPGPTGEILARNAGIDEKSLGLPLFGGLPAFVPVLTFLREMRAYSISPDRLRELQDPDEGEQLEADGRNAASVLRRLEPSARQELIEMLAFVVPGVTGVKSARRGNKLTMQFVHQSKAHKSEFDALQVSDGTLRILGLLLALYQRGGSRFLEIEEPESTIHVAALQALVEVFRARSSHTQILLTTHSSEILDSVSLDELHLVTQEDGVSKLDSVSGDAKTAIEQALFSPGELLRTGSLSNG